MEICTNILTERIYGNRVLLPTWPGAMKIYCNKRMFLQREKAQQDGHRQSLSWETNMAAMTSRKNTVYLGRDDTA